MWCKGLHRDCTMPAAWQWGFQIGFGQTSDWWQSNFKSLFWNLGEGRGFLNPILCLMEDSLLVSKKQQHLSQVCLCSKRSITRHTGYLAHHNTHRLLRIICLVGIISSSEYTVEWLCTQRAISSLCRWLASCPTRNHMLAFADTRLISFLIYIIFPIHWWNCGDKQVAELMITPGGISSYSCCQK